jgi:hypothetical protein
MKPDRVATAITQALVQGGALWLVATIVAVLPALWTMTLILHLGRPYVLRFAPGRRHLVDVLPAHARRRALTHLRAELDLLRPHLVMNAALPITGPLAALCLLLALAVKLSRRVDDDVQASRLATALLVVGATRYDGALVFAVEAASQEYLAGFGQVFTSNANPTVALWIMWLSLVGVAIVAGWLFLRLLASANRTMARQLSAPPSRSTPEQTAAVPSCT